MSRLISCRTATAFSSKTLIRSLLVCFLVIFSQSTSRAFISPTLLSSLATRTPTSNAAQASRLGAAIPVLDRWQIMPNGSIIGTVRDHPSIDDGDVITTSPISDPDAAKSQMVVETASGSKYRLLTPLLQPSNNKNVAQNLNNNGASVPAPNFSFRVFGAGETPSTPDAQAGSSPSYPKLRSGPAWKEAVAAYQLAQQFIGLDEEFLLAGKPTKSTSGKSNIWEAYAADEATGGLPKIGEPSVCIKVSSNMEAVSREYENYRKLSFLGIARGRFVKCHEFFPVAGYEKKFKNQCALVLERGSQDLKTFLTSRGKLEGKELRDACMAAAQCVQALHNVGLVWTDLKTENFVVMGENGEVKGIDLESAMPVGDNPVDYSPEACPPEFAAAFLEGEGPYFVLDTSYDVWSLGMLMLELSTGEGFFDGNTPAQITKWLRDCEYGIPVDDIDVDDRLKDLLRRCLQKDPKKRPNMAQILLHPYFITSPLSIFQNFS